MKSFFKYSCFITLITIYSCINNGQKPKVIRIPSSAYITSKQGIIVSCYRCNCIDEFLLSANYLKIKKKNVYIYLDSMCKKEIKINHIQLNQKEIDSVYLQNYNMLFFKYDSLKKDYIISLQKTDNDFTKNYLSFFEN